MKLILKMPIAFYCLKKDSPIPDVKVLKGKRIAVTQGLSAHYLLSQVLDQAELTWQDMQPIWLTPADARAAIDKKSVDAWVIWDPYASTASIKGDTRVLTDATHLAPAYSFYSSADRSFLEAAFSRSEKIH